MSDFNSEGEALERHLSHISSNMDTLNEQSFTYHMKYLWIIEKCSAKSMFYHEFTKNSPLDGLLISGLLSALNNFSEVELGETGIESIEMGGLRWVYLKDDNANLLLVTAGEKNSNTKLMSARLQVIRDMFVRQFQIDEEFWDNWGYEIGQFRKFSEIVEMLDVQWTQADQIMNVGALFDLMGVFQQIFYIFIKMVQENFVGLKLHAILEKLTKYHEKLEIWYQQQNLSDTYRVIEIFIPQIDLVSDEIIFTEAPATNIFGLNPIGLDQHILIPLFFLVMHHFKEVIQSELSEAVWLTLVKKEIVPFLFHKWEFLKPRDLNKEILNLFFST